MPCLGLAVHGSALGSCRVSGQTVHGSALRSCRVTACLGSVVRGSALQPISTFLADCPVRRDNFTQQYTLEQNGVAERKNRSLMETAQCMVKSQALTHSF